MKKGTKVFVGVGCSVLLVGAIVVGAVGIVVLNLVDKSVQESTKEFEERGRQYGAKTDQQGCMDEGIRRSKSIGVLDLGAGIKLASFVDECLKASRPTPNFCDGVPSFWSLQETEWGSGICRRAGVDPERTACIHVTKRKHEFCSKPF